MSSHVLQTNNAKADIARATSAASKNQNHLSAIAFAKTITMMSQAIAPQSAGQDSIQY